MMKNISIGCAALMLLIYCSCNSVMKNDFENESIEKLKKANQERLTILDPWDTIPSPISWINDRNGTGPYQPQDPNYFYVGDDPDVKFGDEYTNYVHFYWYAFPAPIGGVDTATFYMMQIQYRHGYSGPGGIWRNIKSPRGNGLVKIMANGILEDMSAYFFPYKGPDYPMNIILRTRVIHNDFLTSTPDPHAELNLYDRSLVSEWSNFRGWENPHYYNPWGFGKPQPEPRSGGGWENADSTAVLDGQILVTVDFPISQYHSFSYEISNLTGGLTQTYSGQSPNFLGVGKHHMMGVGSGGGKISVFVLRTENNYPNAVHMAAKSMDYGLGEKTLNMFFSENEFNY